MPGADRSLSDFSIGASFVDGQAVLALRGEVDALTAPEFGAFFETVIDRGHRTVILDLVGLGFMDASGVAVIARGAARLEVMGGTLAIRTPPALIRRVLEITGFARLVMHGDHKSGRGPVGSPDSHPMTTSVRQFGAIHSDDEVVAQAQGVLMESEGLAEDDAYSMLRYHSVEKEHRDRETAEDIVESTRGPEHA